MKNKNNDFEFIKDNPKKSNKNYIFQNNKITRIGFYIVLSLLITSQRGPQRVNDYSTPYCSSL